VVATRPAAEVVFANFHVLQHTGALDEVRRQEFFRATALMRTYGRGKRWLRRRRWKTIDGTKRQELARLFAANRRLFKAYVVREQLNRPWTYTTRAGVARWLFGRLKALRWQRLPEIEKLGDTLVRHFDAIAAYCDLPVRFGVVESLNTTIKAVIRRARGVRDDPFPLLKLKWATAHSTRSARDYSRFLNGDLVHGNR
jgi:transposase